MQVYVSLGQIWVIHLMKKKTFFSRGTICQKTTQMLVVTRYQYGIHALVPETSFRTETSGGVAKCWLNSEAQATCKRTQSKLHPFAGGRGFRVHDH